MMKNQNEVFTFQFSESQNQVRSILIDDKPCFVANDACSVLGIANPRDAIKSLDDDEKLTSVLPTLGQNRRFNLVTESGLYALIFQSRKPQAKKFRKWITSEVIPALRKTGSYKIPISKKEDYIDYRHEVYSTTKMNGKKVRFVIHKDEEWYSLNDRNRAHGVTTGSAQQSKTLGNNVLKFWIYGNTNPSWFVNKKGLQLLELGKKATAIIISPNQLSLSL